MGLLDRAKQKSVTQEKTSKKKGTTWVAGDPNGDKIGNAVEELVRINADIKALTAKKRIHSQIVQEHADGKFISNFADMGVMPESPMKVVNAKGNSVTFVVQDRSSQYNVKSDQVSDLYDVLGKDGTDKVLYDETTVKFSREIMALPGVMEAVDKALTSAAKRMVKDEILTEDQADQLVEVDEKLSFKPGTLQMAAQLVGQDQTRLGQFLDAMGSSVVRYVKS